MNQRSSIGQFVSAGMILALSMGCSNSSTKDPPTPARTSALGDTVQQKATWTYWQGLLQVTKKLDAAAKRSEIQAMFKAEPKNPEQFVSLIRRTVKTCENGSEILRNATIEIEAMPLLDVDNDALEIGTLVTSALRETRSGLSDIVPLLKETAKVIEDSNSFGTLVEMLIVGDRRISDQKDRLQTRWDRINERFEASARKNERIPTQIRQVRIKLTQKYGREYPNLD